MIGDITPAEWTVEVDAATGRTVQRLTDGRSNSYALYYFVPSVTPDGRYLVLHSERSGAVQLYRLDLSTGEIGQLTDGHTKDAGWAVWCEWHLDGIYNHLSAIHPLSGELYYFQDREIRAADVATFANRLVALLPAGRMPIGQAAFSPDGRWFLYLKDGQVIAHDLRAGNKVNLTEVAGVDFVDVEDDHPYELPVYGVEGWTADGRSVLLNHRFDVWQVPLAAGAHDTLLVEIRGEDEVWVKFQDFKAGIADKIPVA